MRSLILALIALMFTGLFATHAIARDQAVSGVFVGMDGGGMSGVLVSYNDRDRYGRDHYRRGHRPDVVCRDIVVVRERHGRYREVIKTVCRDRGDWRRPHYRDRYRDGRYGYNDRW
jgi:hypothetical protein